MVRIACGLLVLLAGADDGDRSDIVARIAYEVDLSKKHPGEPQSAALDLFVRSGRDWTFGLTHSHAGRGLVDSGAGVCLSGCDDRYRDVGLEARWRFLRAGLVVDDFEPLKPQLLVGAGRAWRVGALSFAADPYLRLGLAHRDRGNRDFFNLPVLAEARWRGRAGAYLMTGLNGLLTELGDYWSVPAAVGAVAAPGWGFEVRVQLGFSHLLGPLNTLQDRHLMISVARRFRIPALQPQPRRRFSSRR